MQLDPLTGVATIVRRARATTTTRLLTARAPQIVDKLPVGRQSAARAGAARRDAAARRQHAFDAFAISLAPNAVTLNDLLRCGVGRRRCRVTGRAGSLFSESSSSTTTTADADAHHGRKMVRGGRSLTVAGVCSFV